MSIIAEWLTTNSFLGPKAAYAVAWLGALALCGLVYLIVKGF